MKIKNENEFDKPKLFIYLLFALAKYLIVHFILEIEIYKIRLIHVFILFLTFRPLLKALSSYCKYFFTNRIILKIMQLSVLQFYR